MGSTPPPPARQGQATEPVGLTPPPPSTRQGPPTKPLGLTPPPPSTCQSHSAEPVSLTPPPTSTRQGQATGRRSFVPAATPARVPQDAGASLIRRSSRQKRTVTRGYYPPITVRPAPSFDPPYVDEPGADEWYREAAGQLAFDFSALTRRPGNATAPQTTAPATTQAPLTASPEARHAAGRFTRACLEILNGYRPVAHVRSLSRPTNAHALVEQLFDALRRMPVSPAQRRQQPELVRLRHLRISEPTPGIVEAAAALGTDARTWAMAFRLEHTSTRWLGTVLQVL
ncbi:Rv3235 family protein [Asanoa sp. NPDC049518]